MEVLNVKSGIAVNDPTNANPESAEAELKGNTPEGLNASKVRAAVPLRYLQAMRLLVADEKSRHFLLRSVLLECDGDGQGLLLGMDGKRMGLFRLFDFDGPKTRFAINADDLEWGLKAIESVVASCWWSDCLVVIEQEVANDPLAISLGGLPPNFSPALKMQWRLVEGHYPEWRGVIPKDSDFEGAKEIVVAAEMLKNWAEIAELLTGQENVGIRFWFSNRTGMIQVMIGMDSRFYGLMMPQYGEASEGIVPEWVTKEVGR